jgi:hypothetical protein
MSYIVYAESVKFLNYLMEKTLKKFFLFYLLTISCTVACSFPEWVDGYVLKNFRNQYFNLRGADQKSSDCLRYISRVSLAARQLEGGEFPFKGFQKEVYDLWCGVGGSEVNDPFYLDFRKEAERIYCPVQADKMKENSVEKKAQQALQEKGPDKLNDFLYETIVKLTTTEDKLEREIDRLQDEVDDLIRNNKDLERKLKEATEKLYAETKEDSKLEVTCKNQKHIIIDLKKRLKRLNRLKKQSQLDTQELTKEKKENARLKAQVAGMSAKELDWKELKADLEQSIGQMQQTNQDLQHTKNHALQEGKDWKKKYTDLTKNLQEQLMSLNKSQEEKKELIEQLNTALRTENSIF